MAKSKRSSRVRSRSCKYGRDRKSGRCRQKYGGNKGDEKRSKRDYGRRSRSNKSSRSRKPSRSRKSSGHRRHSRRHSRRGSRVRSPWAGWDKECPDQKQRLKMRKKCKSKCFLEKSGTAFPICKKDTCKISRKGIWAAYVRARQNKHPVVAKRADKLLGRKSRSRRSRR